ncbi:IS3 family transposase [Trueperella pyogenes]|uniref:IS3 family transposase n=1 Tax=Trueperella pyogenes TaxID=1661 RepID=UPI00345DB97D
MRDEEGCFPVAWMCRKLEVSRSSFYEWKQGLGVLNSYELRRQELAVDVREIFNQQRGRAGARGITAELQRRGYRVSVKLVGRVMRENGLEAIQPRAWKRTTICDANAECVVLDLVGQDFNPEHYEPGEVLVGDITYLKTPQGWLYLATVIDLATRKVVGWHIADHMRTSLITTALDMARGNGAQPGCVFHSDRGSQYTSQEFAQYCEDNFVYQSMGRVATCYDNAVAESFFSTLKVEFYYQQAHSGGIATIHEVGEWIRFYNQIRFHASLGYQPPVQAWVTRQTQNQALAA